MWDFQNQSSQQMYIKVDISKVLGIDKECLVERAHRLGTPQHKRRGPRRVIVKYQNYGDKSLILQKFRSHRELQIEGQDLLIFADYSMGLSKKQKLFNKV